MSRVKSQLVTSVAGGLLVISLAGAVSAAQAPQAAAQPAGLNVAVLDVNHIFEHYKRFATMKSQIDVQVKRATAESKREKEAIEALAKQLSKLKPGSKAYEALEEQLTNRQALLPAKMEMQEKAFLQQEAKMYYTVYRELAQEAAQYAKANGIQLVLRVHGDPVDIDNPDDVVREVEKSVIWFDKSRDITAIILDRLNKKAAQPKPAAAGPAKQKAAPARKGS